MKLRKSMLNMLFLSIGCVSLSMIPSVITSAASTEEKSWMFAVLIGITTSSLILTDIFLRKREVVEKKPFEVEAGVQVDIEEKNALSLTRLFKRGGK